MITIEKIIGSIFCIIGLIILFSALPQQTPNIWDLGIIKLNVGTQLDMIRLVLGIVSIYIGIKIYGKFR